MIAGAAAHPSEILWQGNLFPILFHLPCQSRFDAVIQAAQDEIYTAAARIISTLGRLCNTDFADQVMPDRLIRTCIRDQIRSCINALDRIKTANLPAPAKVTAFDYERVEGPTAEEAANMVASEISASLQALVGTTDEVPPKAEPRHPVSDTTGKFTNLRFGPNYDPTKK